MNNYPFTKVRQQFESTAIADIEQAVAHQFKSIKWRCAPGARIAIAVGSRGIANISRIAKAVVMAVKAKGGDPFIIPAMGSHGGATAEGQREILASYGVMEEEMGCPVRSSMEVMELDNGDLEIPLFMDRHAFESDGVILINRIKPHTAFHGDYESGLVKMSVIGLGKERLANALHAFGIYGLKTMMPKAARKILATGKIILGIGIVENAYDETAFIAALTPEEILRREPELLNTAKAMMPSFPLNEIDVLVVDALGKNISGSGMDPNIIGRMRIRGEVEPEFPAIKVIVVTDLTDASHGNACGIGLADLVTRRLADKIDWDATYMNGITSGFYEHFMLPIVAPTDAQALEWGIRASHDPRRPKKIVRITDTLHLSEMYVSEAALKEIKDRVEILSEPENLFDEQGSLITF
ncbi:MAG: nickel-dependent lactate racemase [Acidobacteriota bacterium]|nr:nickel-dependent lactate racemase [Acidobacteriota bacterium]